MRDYGRSEGGATARPPERCAEYACGLRPVRSRLAPLRRLANGCPNASTTRALDGGGYLRTRVNYAKGNRFFLYGNYDFTVADGCGWRLLEEFRRHVDV